MNVSSTSILAIPGFGESLTNELLRWRKHHEANFRFNPNEPVDPRDLTGLDRELGERGKALGLLLQRGPGSLEATAYEIAAARTRLMPSLETAWDQLRIARSKLESL